jgi:O-antigen/teichoic acid export membrane protein
VQKQTLKMARLVAVALLVKCVLNILLLPRLGLWGAVIPNVAGFALMTFLYGWYSRHLLPVRISLTRLLIYGGAATLAALAGTRVVLPGMLISLIARSMTAVSVYGAVLWLLDARIREWTRVLFSKAGARRRPV